MSWWFAAASFGAGVYGAEVNKKGKLAQGREFDRAAEETMLTEAYNRKKRNIESRQTDLSTLEQGARALSDVAMQGQKDQASIKTESSGSGAVVSSGTTLDVMMTEAVNNTVQQLSVVDATQDAIGSNQRHLKNTNESENRNARNRAMGLKRQADMTRKSAQDQYTADVLGATVKAASVYASNKSPAKPDTVTKGGPQLTGGNAQHMHGQPKVTTWGKTKMYGRNIFRNMKTKNFTPSAKFSTIYNR
mgnify:CR=1 FL=1